MQKKGTFIISGAETSNSQPMIRSPGIYFSIQEDPASGRKLCMAKLIPEHGTWLESDF